jgi:hypothetical protein
LNLAICYAIMPMVFLVACGEPVRLAEHKTVRITEDSNGLQKVIRDEETLQQTTRDLTVEPKDNDSQWLSTMLKRRRDVVNF